MSSAFLIPVVYFAAALDAWLSPHWQVRGIGPDLLALVAFGWLATARGRHAFVVAALVGLVSDLGSSAPLGIGMAAFAVTSFAVIYLRQNLQLEGKLARLGIIWLGATTTCLLQGIALLLMRQITLPWMTLIERAALVGLYTTGLAIPLLMAISWLRTNNRATTSAAPT